MDTMDTMENMKPLRLTAKDFDQSVLDLYDGYAHGIITRREFLDRAGKYALAAGVTATALLEMLTPKYALAQQVDPKDASIKTEYVNYNSPKGHNSVRAYVVKPANASGKIPGVVVVHENRGLNPYIEDVARRVAKAGYLAFAPDGLTPLGGYPGNDEKGVEMQRTLDAEKLRQDFFAAMDTVKGRSDVNTKLGVVGFCYGGGISNAMAVQFPELAAAVPYYGAQPKAEDVPKIKASLLIHYAGLDTRTNEGWPAYEAALKANKVNHTMHMYPEVNHGFHNDTTPRYDAAAAKLSWDRTVAFFKEKLA
jgi:carboxymethylenebutenolidase